MPPRNIYVPDSKFVHSTYTKATGKPDHIGEKDAFKDVPLFPNGKPEYKDIIQSEDKACFILGTLASIVRKRPDDIKKMIDDNGDGTVTVHFYAIDYKTKEKVPFDVKVDKTPTAIDDESALWANLIEKAYAASGLHRTGGVLDLPPEEDFFENKYDPNALIDMRESSQGRENEGNGYYAVIDGGSSNQVLNVLYPGSDLETTRESYTNVIHSKNEEDGYKKFKETLENAIGDKDCIVTANTNYNHLISVASQQSTYKEVNGKKEIDDLFIKTYNQKKPYDSNETIESEDWNTAKTLFEDNSHAEVSKYQYITSINIANLKTGKYETFILSNLTKRIEDENKALKDSDFYDLVVNNIIEKNGLDKVSNAQKDIRNKENGAAEHYIKYNKIMRAALQHEKDKYMEERRTLYDLREELLSGKSPIIVNLEAALYSSAVHNKTQDTYMPDALRNRIKETVKSREENGGYYEEKIVSDKKDLLSYSEKLKNAKFWRKNSPEYMHIIDALNEAADETVVPEGMQYLTPEQRYAAKLVNVQNKIGEYLQHKAKDGVNSYAYRKLEAVENISQKIDAKLRNLSVPTFEYKGEMISRFSAEASYENMKKDFDENADVRPEFKKRVPEPMTNQQYKALDENVQKKYKTLDDRYINNVDRCMSKIILRAIKSELPEEKINGLETVRRGFGLASEDLAKKLFDPYEAVQYRKEQQQAKTAGEGMLF